MVLWTLQDIVLTLKDKLSLRAIEYFALVLEQQYSITKLLLLQEDELIQKVGEGAGTHTHTHTQAHTRMHMHIHRHTHLPVFAHANT